MPPELVEQFKKIEEAYLTIGNSHNFIRELRDIRKHYQGRPTPVYYAKRLSEYVGGARIYLKREDLNHTGAHKLNHCMGEALLAKYLGKKKLIAETGAGQHGVALATAAAYFGLECEIHMGEADRDNSLVHSAEHFVLATENKVFLYDETKCSFKGNKVFPLMKQTVRLRETLCSVWQNTFYLLICF